MPVISLPVEHRVCAGDNIIIEAIVQNAQEFQWSLDGVVLPTETTNTIITSQPGLYRLEAISEFGCRDFGVSTLFEYSVPQVDLGTDIEECEGESVILDAGSEGIQYQWYFNSNLIAGQELSTYTPMGSGQYSVIVTNEANCQNSDDIAVRFFSSPILSSIEDNVNIFQGEQTTFVITELYFINFQW